MNAIKKFLFVFITLQEAVFAQNNNDCLIVTNVSNSDNFSNECVTLNVKNNSDSTIECIISVQEYRYADSSWIESWSDINWKKITVCKPASPIVTIPVDSTITKKWCPNECIDYFGIKWTDEKIRGQEENKERMCRFAFYMFHADLWKLEKKPFYYSESFFVIVDQ